MELRSAPFGLPPKISISDYWNDPVCKLSGLNYKVEAEVKLSPDTWLQALSVVDTGAGPNLIRADLLPSTLLDSIDRSTEVVNLASASGHALDIVGILTLPVRIGNQTTSNKFVVSQALNADVLLGCHYLDTAVDNISIQRRTLTLNNGETVPIARRRATTPFTKANSHRIIRSAKTITIPARTEMFIEVQSTMRGTHIITSNPALFNKYRCVVANGLAEIRPNVVFHVQVANMSEHPVSIPKGMRVGFITPAPHVDSIQSVDWSSPNSSRQSEPHSKEGVEEITSEKPKMSQQENRAFTHLNTKKVRKPDIVNVEDIPLPDLSHTEKSQVRGMLEPFKEMWKPGKVGKVNVTEHHIDIQPGAKPQFSQPYRAGPHARRVIKNTIDEMLEQDIIEPSRSEWAAPVVLAPKGDAQFFSTLDCNWGFWQIPLADKDRSKSAFTTHAGTFQYKRMR